jgi:hypothetical protein
MTFKERVALDQQAYRELKVLVHTVVRAVKDEATPDAEDLLFKHLLEQRIIAQQEVFERIHAAHQEMPLGADEDSVDMGADEDGVREGSER